MKRILLTGGMVAAMAVRVGAQDAETPPMDGSLYDQARLRAIGTWDGKTASAELQGPYEDPLQQEVPFGRRSYYLAPWRSYMDTWPAARYLETVGITFNVSPFEADATAQLLAEAGVRSARVEIGWGDFFQFGTEEMQPRTKQNLAKIIGALAKYKIRPLILLNANSGQPVTTKAVRVNLLQDAPAGARELILDKTDGIKLDFTGLRGQARPIAYPLITTIGEGGKVTLSRPLVKEVKAGPLDLQTLDYHPLGGTEFADGTPNPEAQHTLDGWRKYVAGVGTLMQEILGTKGAADAGFDVEVWNEYTFGSEFLDEKNYYDPPRAFKTKLTYSSHGRTMTGPEVLLPITVDYFNDPTNGLPGVNVISGFSNQRPWDSGTGLWPGQAGFSRHYYTGLADISKPNGDDVITRLLGSKDNSGPLDAQGRPEGTPDGKDWHTVVPGSFFTPTYVLATPERWHFAVKTEFVTRDIQPIEGPWRAHGRFANNGDGRTAQVWMTETNTWRRPWANWLASQAKLQPTDERLHPLMQAIGAKTTLRAFVFNAHKGVHTITMYAAKAGDFDLGVINDKFFETLKAENYVLTDKARAEAGSQIEVLRRMNQLMRSGEPIGEARPLRVERIVEYKPRVMFLGDGTASNPTRYNRDDFAVLPFQLAADRFAIGYYVVTRNAARDYDYSKDVLDPTRYQMPPQEFDLTLSNLRGAGAQVSATDPLTGEEVPARVIASSPKTLTVRVLSTDAPRFLMVKEAAPGPLVLNPKVDLAADGKATVTLDSNIPATPTVSWGSRPERKADGSVGLPPGTHFQLKIPALKQGAGVRISLATGDLLAVWPRWGDDVVGAHLPPHRADGEEPRESDYRLPVLPAGDHPSAIRVDLPPGVTWQGQGDLKTATLGEKDSQMSVGLKVIDYPQDVTSLFPATSNLDRVLVRRLDGVAGNTRETAVWAKIPGWYGNFVMDPLAHPGLAETFRRIYLVPLKDGRLAVLEFHGSATALRQWGKQITELADTVKVDW